MTNKVSRCCQAVMKEEYIFNGQPQCPCCYNLCDVVRLEELAVGDWKTMREIDLERKARKRATETDTLLTLRNDGFIIHAFTLYHYRVNDVIDIYPTSKKYYDRVSKKWGRYRDIIDFVHNFFPKKTEQP